MVSPSADPPAGVAMGKFPIFAVTFYSNSLAESPGARRELGGSGKKGISRRGERAYLHPAAPKEGRRYRHLWTIAGALA